MGAAMIVALGGIVPIFLISLLIGRFVFKNREIKKKVIYSTLIAYQLSNSFYSMSPRTAPRRICIYTAPVLYKQELL